MELDGHVSVKIQGMCFKNESALNKGSVSVTCGYIPFILKNMFLEFLHYIFLSVSASRHIVCWHTEHSAWVFHSG